MELFILGISAFHAIYIAFIVFCFVMSIFIFSKVCSRQWLAFWGILGHGVSVLNWNIRYLFHVRVIDKIFLGPRRFLNKIAKIKRRIAQLEQVDNAEAKAEIEDLNKQLVVLEKEYQTYLAFINSPGEFNNKKVAFKIRKMTTKREVLVKKQEHFVSYFQAKIKKDPQFYEKMLELYKSKYDRKIEIVDLYLNYYKNIATISKTQKKAILTDVKVKKRHLRRDFFEVRQKYIEARRKRRHKGLLSFLENIKNWNKNFSEKIKNYYANLKHEIDGFNNSLRTDEALANFFIAIALFIPRFLYVIGILITGLLRDIFLGIVSLFVVLIPSFFSQLPFKLFYYVVDFPRGFVYEFIKFFTSDLKDNIKGYVYLAPVLIILVVFTFYPILSTFIISFQEGYILQSGSFDGFGIEAYTTILNQSKFRRALTNTMFITFVSVPISVTIALLLSAALNSIKRLQGLYQIIFFLPYITNTIAIGMVFFVLFADGGAGFVNTILGFFGVDPIVWIGSTAYGPTTWIRGMTVIIIYGVWNALAFKIMVFLSGMQNINKQYYQAAKVDGASKVRTFTRITVPMISPMIAYVSITSFIGTFKTYTSVIAIYEGMSTSGRSVDKIFITIVGYIMEIFEVPNVPGAMTKASAGAVILLAIIMAFTGIQMYISSKKVHY